MTRGFTPVSCSLSARNLEVAYESFVALNIPALEIAGPVIGLIGHNGAGKSTLIKSILGLLPPRKGALDVFLNTGSGNVRMVPEHDMIFCPETGSVFGDISVESYVKLWCRIRHNDAFFYKKGGAKYIELLNLPPLLKKLGRELSKGERRRVQTGIGFLVEPKLFLFDEPFDGLDVQRTSELTEIIRAETEQTTFVVSSHRMDVVERLADVIIVLKEGGVIAGGPVTDVIRAMCPRSLVIRGITSRETLELFKETYPDVIVNVLGDQHIVAGDIREEEVRVFLAARETGPVHVTEIASNLVDAMNVHLKSLQKRPTAA